MKIAVCISGLPRFWTGFPKHKFGDVDYFIHTWRYKSEDIADTCFNRFGEIDAEVHSSEWCNIPAINDFFKPKILLVEDYNTTTKDFFNLLTANFDTGNENGRRSVLPMFYGIERIIKRAYVYSQANHTKYDLVIRCRFDTRFQYFEIRENPGLYIPENNSFEGINDQFAYGDMSSMLYYCEVYSKLLGQISDRSSLKTLLNPEIILKEHLKNQTVVRFKEEITLERV
jgi:hypothetical protein